ncbi:MAG: phosphoglycerate kinase [Chloroflexota bacterium]|nr:phosphoglycerate kinase [Chloroflexota bacterium]
MDKKTIRDIEVGGKRVLVRVDFNVPLDKHTGQITDDRRIQAALPTIKHLIENKAKTILCSHLGRPKGVTPELRLEPIGKRLSEHLGISVQTVPECIGSQVETVVAGMKEGEVLLLENLRFHPEEEKNDAEFSKALASLADVYVNDAFGTAHRAHASTEGVAHHLPAVAGFLLEKELEFLGKSLANPSRPFAMIVGGAKVSDKITMLDNILPKIDILIIGGGMANTFLKAQGYDIGKSKVEDDQLDFARRLISEARDKGVCLLLPLDTIAAERFEAESPYQVTTIEKIPSDSLVLDIGPNTIDHFKRKLSRCHTVVWNGPMGVFEFNSFAKGTKEIASLLAELDATTIIGGGDSAAAVEQMGLADRMTHVSTGGGASLEFLEGKPLPGVSVLLDR